MVVGGATAARAVVMANDFESFYRREHAPLYRAVALTLRDADLARDAVDEAMVRAYQRWGAVSRYDNPSGWVYRVALNWAVSKLRRRWRPSAAAVDVEQELRLPDPDLAAALQGLPTSQRAVVVLRFHLDWSLEQIAGALGLPLGTVKSRLHRALAMLRDSLGAIDEH